MKHNNFSFLVGEGTKAIFKHGFMSFAAVCITVACLVIVTNFGLITYNIGLIVDDLQKENEVLICIDESYTEAEAKSVGSRINLIDNVADARFISREEALQTFVKEYDAVMYDGVTAETMRDQYIVTLEDNSKLQETIDALKQVPGVATIYSDPTVANAMSTIRNVLSIVSACCLSCRSSSFPIRSSLPCSTVARRSPSCAWSAQRTALSVCRLWSRASSSACWAPCARSSSNGACTRPSAAPLPAPVSSASSTSSRSARSLCRSRWCAWSRVC